MYNETVNIWWDNFKEENVVSKESLKREIEEIKGSIKNEALWARGSTDKEDADMHLNNIRDMHEYLDLLHVKLGELK